MVKLYHDGKACVEAPGLSLVPKLKHEHIYLILTIFLMMRVDLAAQVYIHISSCIHSTTLLLLNVFYATLIIQVLSGTVSKALSLTGGEVATETIHFVSMMDHFFDYFNVGNYTAGKLSRNPFKEPYRSVSDFRLNVSGNDINRIQSFDTFFSFSMYTHSG